MHRSGYPKEGSSEETEKLAGAEAALLWTKIEHYSQTRLKNESEMHITAFWLRNRRTLFL